ncbi:hypothetical protein O1611_g9659 [Lasiodiplodia mahajangana]|uniref:Uncharacterized protein n=1 Tax=Lasiodiplodia mahajangana TaxID=1108764 RepID=A0ACC2J6W4_9PEZI|nr:hypothetical protein O1611_g9659 [Lasiodiplodia mahajangana]
MPYILTPPPDPSPESPRQIWVPPEIVDANIGNMTIASSGDGWDCISDLRNLKRIDGDGYFEVLARGDIPADVSWAQCPLDCNTFTMLVSVVYEKRIRLKCRDISRFLQRVIDGVDEHGVKTTYGTLTTNIKTDDGEDLEIKVCLKMGSPSTQFPVSRPVFDDGSPKVLNDYYMTLVY